MASNLTKRIKRFCDEYVIDHNGTQAAIRAGYSQSGAKVTASRLLTKDNVKAYLAQKEAVIDARLEITAERIKKELARVAFQDARKFFDAKGNLIPIHELDDDAAAALAGMEVDDFMGITSKIKRFDKVKALELLGKSEGIFEKDNDQKKNETVVTPFTDEQVDKIITSLRKTA